MIYPNIGVFISEKIFKPALDTLTSCVHEVKKNMQILSKWRDQQSLKNSATSMYVMDNYIMHPM